MNQRRRTRVESRKGVTLEWGEASLQGELVNVSLKGCLVDAARAAAPAQGVAVEVTIHLEPGAAELDVHLQGVIARRLPEGIGVEFTEVSPESFQHLFRLVQYNAADPEEIEGELGTSAFESSSG